MKSIKIIRVIEDQLLQRIGFSLVYKSVFAEAPYFETYTDDWVAENVWYMHLRNGYIVLALSGEKVIGLGCSIRLTKIIPNDPNIEVKNFLFQRDNIPINLSRTCYMSEIAVLPDYRSKGIGRSLIQRRFILAKTDGMSYFIMRTAQSGSMSENLYLNLGAKDAGIVQDISDHAEKINSSSRFRKYLYGEL
ncbi:MAG: GNAT family N-acetyltransferase [Patescibacteria group bacterium]|jgi:ribosomal protein S18 acetylase RimI-like enzyme